MKDLLLLALLGLSPPSTLIEEPVQPSSELKVVDWYYKERMMANGTFCTFFHSGKTSFTIMLCEDDYDDTDLAHRFMAIYHKMKGQ